jgi:hypothetical protein
MGKRLMLAALAAAMLGCSESTAPETALFTVEVSGEQFKVQAQGDVAIAAMQTRLQSGQTGVISGTLVRGNGGFNTGWGWHLEPSTVTAPDLAMELCDGRPSFVQNDLDYWLSSVKLFCPWGARVVARN